MRENRLLLSTTLLAVLLLFAGVWFGRASRRNVNSMPYTQFISNLATGKVTKVTITNDTAEARLKNDPKRYTVDLPQRWQTNAQLNSKLAVATKQGTNLEVRRPFFSW